MRQPYAHEAVLVMAPDADLRAPGGAITVELCGSGDHEPHSRAACRSGYQPAIVRPLAAHYTSAERVGGEVAVRVLFATEPDREAEVRRRIDAALAEGWQVISSGPGPVAADEREHAERLTRSVA